jgi:hypothetical protein
MFFLARMLPSEFKKKFITIYVHQGQQAVLQAPAQEPHAFGACKERSPTYEQERLNTRFKPLQLYVFFTNRAIEIGPYRAVNISGFGIRIRMNLSCWFRIQVYNFHLNVEEKCPS